MSQKKIMDNFMIFLDNSRKGTRLFFILDNFICDNLK